MKKGGPGAMRSAAVDSDSSDGGGGRKGNDGSSSDSEDDEEYLDSVAEPMNPIKNQDRIQMAQKARTSVSAEVFGRYHIKEEFKAKVVPKSLAVMQKIKERLSNAFMFMSLDPKDLKVVIDAMDEKKVQGGEFVIREGENGDVLYIVESGELSCSKVLGGQETFLKNYSSGDVFGELALLYNAPRAATIKADTESSLWVLDRNTFNNIVKDASQNKRNKYE